MKDDIFQKVTLLKYLYLLGFGVLTIVFAVYRFWVLPDGLSTAEIESAAISGQFSLSQLATNFSEHTSWLVNLPWTILQNLSISIFGFSTFALRLPAVILMTLSAFGLVFVACKLLKKNIAITSGFLIISSALFMSLARSGDGAAMMIFLIALTLLSVVKILSVQSGWQEIFFRIITVLALASLLYMRGGIYIIATVTLVGVLHPKIRLFFLRDKIWKLIPKIVIGLIIVAPLAIGFVVGSHDFIWSLLLVDGGSWSLQNLSLLGTSLTGIGAGLSGGLITPIIGIVGLIIAVIGLIKVIANFFSVRSYLILALLILAVKLSIYQPQFTFLLFIPLALLMTIGISILIEKWSNLFPLNPYAHVIVSFLVGFIIFINCWVSISHFIAANKYDSTVVYHYNQEFDAVREFLSSQDESNFTLVVAENEKDFYQNLTRDFVGLRVAANAEDNDDSLIILNSSNQEIDKVPTKVVTNSRLYNSILLRIY